MNARRWAAAAAFVAFASAMLGIDTRATYGARVSADEPQYLLTALSLAEDFDLDISDELATEAYLDFHEVALNPQTIELDDDGQRLSPHDPLLPLLLAAPMGLGGWVAAKASLAVFAALTAAATVVLAARRFDVASEIAGPVVAAFFVGAPFSAYGTQVYPAMPAALCVVVGVYCATDQSTLRSAAVATGAVVALPWLAVKYVPLAVVLSGALLWREYRRDHRARAWTIVAVLGASAMAYAVTHQRIYGGWTVYAAGDHFVGGELEVVGTNPNYVARTNRLVGLLVDQAYGVVAWAPGFVLMPAGIAALLRRARTSKQRSSAFVLLVLTAAGWAVATWVALTMHGWWWPGRQIVPVLPLVVVAISVLIDQHRRLLAPVIALGGWAFVNWAWIAFETSTGRRALIVDFTETSNPLYRAWSQLLPNHRVDGAWDQVVTLVWIGVFVASVVVVYRRDRHADTTGQAKLARAS